MDNPIQSNMFNDNIVEYSVKTIDLVSSKSLSSNTHMYSGDGYDLYIYSWKEMASSAASA